MPVAGWSADMLFIKVLYKQEFITVNNLRQWMRKSAESCRVSFRQITEIWVCSRPGGDIVYIFDCTYLLNDRHGLLCTFFIDSVITSNIIKWKSIFLHSKKYKMKNATCPYLLIFFLFAFWHYAICNLSLHNCAITRSTTCIRMKMNTFHNQFSIGAS